ncbi:hypothetical protein GJ496_010701 [Pomphorhynchus laevis]|nr:hypothetical protein GJ496_010701 [Pomphorhynchus laevis]
MFGPDICGLQKRIVHVIINHNGTTYNCKLSPKCNDDVFMHVYTLHPYASNRSYEPSDWDDLERIADPNDKISDNWELPELIEDIEATKPDDWDDEADGDWSASMKIYPAYMGKWVPRTIDNPDYRGP